MQSPSIYLNESQSLESVIEDIKSDPNPNIFHPCVPSFFPPLTLEEARSLDFPSDTINQPDDNLFTDLFDSHKPSLSKKLSNKLNSPYLSICNIDPFQNISQVEQNGLADSTIGKDAVDENGDDNDDRKSLIDQLICLLNPSDEKVLIMKSNNMQNQFNNSQVSLYQEKDSSNQRQKATEISFFIDEKQLINQSIKNTNSLANSKITDFIENDQFVRERVNNFRQSVKNHKNNVKYQRKSNHIIKMKLQNKIQNKNLHIGMSKKQTMMIKRLGKQISNTISIVQKRAIRHQNEDNYEYCWVFGNISCWFSLKLISVLNDLWLCWANSQIYQKQPITQTIKGGSRFDALLQRIQCKHEMDPRVKIKEELKFEGYLNSTKAVFKEIALNKALQFNRAVNKKQETKQESENPKTNSHQSDNLPRSSKKKSKKIIDIVSNSQGEPHKQQQIYHQ